MNKVIFKGKKVTIMVKHIIMLIMLIFVLLFGLKSCNQSKVADDKKQEKIQEVINDKKAFMTMNINMIDEMLERSDLCSLEWYVDFDKIVEVLEEQLSYISKKQGEDYTEIHNAQKILMVSMKNFKETEDIETLDLLEQEFINYKKLLQKFKGEK